MSKLYSSEYKEINVDYLLKIIIKSKIHIVIVTLFMTLFSIYWAHSLEPVFESKALLKIGQYSNLQQSGDIEIVPLDSADELTRELSFVFIQDNKGDESKSSIVKVSFQENIENYIEIVAEGLTSADTINTINGLLSYVQKEHSKELSRNRRKHEVELNNIIDKVSAITKKQRKFLSNDSIYDNKDYTSLLNTLQLMSIINSDLGIGYIGQMLERKAKLELILNGHYGENS